MRTGVYYGEDEPELSRRLDEYLDGLGRRLADSGAASGCVALVLSGGYGRGEGGVFRGHDGVAQLYNDLEFYLFTQSDQIPDGVTSWCHQEERDGTEELGIDVEFKCLGIDALRQGEPSMFYYDLLQGNQLVWGQEDWATGMPPDLSEANLIPLSEATRLMFNRGSGLFYSRCALAQGDERIDDGFVQRNHAKARLALGDAALVANDQYHYFCRERGKRVAAGLKHVPPDWERIQTWHAEGVAFKLRPRHQKMSLDELQKTQRDLAEVWTQTFLWLEGLRLEETFADESSYQRFTGRLYPETPRFRNMLLRVRDLKSRGGALGGWTDYPRAALQRALVELVAPRKEPDAATVSALLSAKASGRNWWELESDYARWWAFYN
ncbi:MAG: hypothetical protein SynsKO_00460 [Synoicihabitans sp.]